MLCVFQPQQCRQKHQPIQHWPGILSNYADTPPDTTKQTSVIAFGTTSTWTAVTRLDAIIHIWYAEAKYMVVLVCLFVVTFGTFSGLVVTCWDPDYMCRQATEKRRQRRYPTSNCQGCADDARKRD
jgi:hypothetical protein